MSGPEDPRPGSDFESFRAARDRFFAKVRPEAMDDPPPSVCPDAVPERWTVLDEREEREDPAGA